MKRGYIDHSFESLPDIAGLIETGLLMVGRERIAQFKNMRFKLWEQCVIEFKRRIDRDGRVNSHCGNGDIEHLATGVSGEFLLQATLRSIRDVLGREFDFVQLVEKINGRGKNNSFYVNDVDIKTSPFGCVTLSRKDVKTRGKAEFDAGLLSENRNSIILMDITLSRKSLQKKLYEDVDLRERHRSLITTLREELHVRVLNILLIDELYDYKQKEDNFGIYSLLVVKSEDLRNKISAMARVLKNDMFKSLRGKS